MCYSWINVTYPLLIVMSKFEFEDSFRWCCCWCCSWEVSCNYLLSRTILKFSSHLFLLYNFCAKAETKAATIYLCNSYKDNYFSFWLYLFVISISFSLHHTFSFGIFHISILKQQKRTIKIAVEKPQTRLVFNVNFFLFFFRLGFLYFFLKMKNSFT